MSTLTDEQKKMAEEILFSEAKLPSFAKRLFFGDFRYQHILPYPNPSTEEKAATDKLIAELQTFITSSLDGDAIDRNAEIPQSVIDGLGKLGILGLTIPSQYSGLGRSQYAYCRACDLVAQYCGATALFINAHQSIGLKALLLFGTEEQKQRYLPQLAKGEAIAAFSLTEPNAGSDAAGIETRAVWDDAKKVWRLHGRKQWTTNGSIAKVLTVMAKTNVDGKDKVTAFLVTPDMPGFVVAAPALEKVGMRGTKTANLNFDGVEVPAENVLGPIGGGLKVCLTVLDYGRTTFGATCTGSARKAIGLALEHAKTRVQFQKPLAAFPLVQRKIARMAGLLYAMDASTYLTAGLVDQGIEDFMLESAILKVFTSESLWEILYESMQIFGGRSFFTDLPLERMMRDARLNMIGEGANEVMRAFIGGVGLRDLGRDLEKASKTRNPFSQYSDLKGALEVLKNSFFKAAIPILSKELAEETAALASAVRDLSRTSVQLLAKHKEAIIDQQFELNRLAEKAIAIYTVTAVLGKLDYDIQTQKATKNEIATGKYYCAEALGLRTKNRDRETIELASMLTGIA